MKQAKSIDKKPFTKAEIRGQLPEKAREWLSHPDIKDWMR